jgi:hypothetical protein
MYSSTVARAAIARSSSRIVAFVQFILFLNACCAVSRCVCVGFDVVRGMRVWWRYCKRCSSVVIEMLCCVDCKRESAVLADRDLVRRGAMQTVALNPQFSHLYFHRLTRGRNMIHGFVQASLDVQNVSLTVKE